MVIPVFFVVFIIPVLTLEPGCRFVHNQCIYNITLKHDGVCNVHEVVSGSRRQGSVSECCHDVKADVSLMKDTESSITQSQELQNQSLNDAPDTEQILQILAQTERQLSSSNSPLAAIIRQAGNEIQYLQNELTTCMLVQNCNGNGRTSTTPLPTPASTTRVAVDYHMTFCDFEDTNSCGYTQTLNHTADWYRGEGRRMSLTGPVDDHTVGTPTGTYMLIDVHKSAIWFKRTTNAFLESPLFDPAPRYCIKFWYHMMGNDIQDLRIFAKIGAGLGYPVWSRSGQQGNDWILGQIDLDSEYTSRQFSLVFEATSQSYYEHVFASHPQYHDYYGNIAIDDIYTYTSKCKDLNVCPPGAYIRRDANSSSCYTFHTSATMWRNAHVTCKHETPNSHLVAVNTKEEQDYLVNVIEKDAGLKAAGNSGFYTSGNDQEKEADFRWTGQGNPIPVTYTNWFPGQPNDVGGNQDCVLLQYPDSRFQWGDIECSSSHPYICEVDLPIN